ncbi:MAG TPA: hypothetical protein VMU59_08970 [Caulobacteraceae bacterium]|nr:hypothetical protein [Caulobacteraceae bacterium]
MAAASKTDSRWARLPNSWIYDDKLTAFSAAPSRRGAAGAALKLLIAIVVRAVNKTAADAGPDQGSALLSYDQLMELTDLSRGMVAKGVALLKASGIVTVEAAPGVTSRYRLSGYAVGDTFGRMPKALLYRGPSVVQLKTLYELSLRNEADVNAMKLYLLICGTQDRNTRIALINHHTIWLKTGIPEKKIRRALSVLYEHGLVSHVVVDQAEAGKPPAAGYRVLGLQ